MNLKIKQRLSWLRVMCLLISLVGLTIIGYLKLRNAAKIGEALDVWEPMNFAEDSNGFIDLLSADNPKRSRRRSLRESDDSPINTYDLTDAQEVDECQQIFPDFCTQLDDCQEVHPFTCCKTVSVDGERTCRTEKGDICSEKDICVAEIVPGGSGAGECFAEWEQNRGLSILVYIFLILYMFIALAIVCDDYFIPSLEKISESLSLSEDVAGATFMAAGTSAPELFVSLSDNVFSNPPKDLGTGTIVGSAIFNILVIIGLTALLAGQDLNLNWRPFARDSAFYLFSVILLTIVVYDSDVNFWEGLLLMLLYGAYVTFMAFNTAIFARLDKFLEKRFALKNSFIPNQNHTSQASTSKEAVENNDRERTENEDFVINNTESPTGMKATDLSLEDANHPQEESQDFKHSNQKKSDSFAFTAPARHTIETDRLSEEVRNSKASGHRDSEPSIGNRHSQYYRQTSVRFSARSKDTSVNPILLSRNRSGRKHFREEPYSLDYQNTAQGHSLFDVARQVILAKRTAKIWREKVEISRSKGIKGTHKSILSFRNYFQILMWPIFMNRRLNTKATDSVPEELGSHRSLLVRIVTDWDKLWKKRLWFVFVFPINLVFRLTIPDCNFDLFCEDRADKPENRRLGFSLAFILCVVWIAALSHFLVYSATVFGCLIGISPAIMGLTLLAAGTSVPDALSSIIVAKHGQGDMAVANAIGSNIFDILIGLGLPWFIAGLAFQTKIFVNTDDLWVGVAFLLIVLVGIVFVLVFNRWVLRKRSGWLLLLIYAIYVVQEVVRGT